MFARALLALGCSVATGCSTVSSPLGVSYQNRPDPGSSFVTPAQPVPRATMPWRSDKPTFVGIGISGGGSRAANFGMAVLQELAPLGILEQVDAISAVSGGSIPAAFFALNAQRADWAERGRAVAATDFLGEFLGKLFNPANIATNTFTDRDRSDLLAEVFQDRVLGGPRVFADLGPRAPMRPAVYFNATDTTHGGQRFVFTDDRFLRSLGSDLSRYPLAWAMASSGAFPGIFNSVTLRQFSVDPETRKTEEPATAARQFVHLVDGGPADNLGTDTLIDLARQHHVQLLNHRIEPRGCMIVVVDSHVPNAAIAEAKRSDRRNVLSAILDLNVFDAIDAMLTNRRNATMARLGVNPEQALGQYTIALGNGLIEYGVQPYRRVGVFEIGYFEQDGRAVARPSYSGLPDTLDFSGQRAATPKSFPCIAWHVALDNIHSVVPWKAGPDGLQPLDLSNPADSDAFIHRGRLARLIKQVATNYRLAGPPNCSAPLVQDTIYEAARIAVREDKAALDTVCAWMRERGLDNAKQCSAVASRRPARALELEPIDPPLNTTAAEQSTNRFVRCPAAPESNAAPH